MKRTKRIWLAITGALLLIPAIYVGAQIHSATKVIYEYETVIQYQMTDSLEAEGVLLCQETPVQGGGMLGYLVRDGERVSQGTPLAEVYTSTEQMQASTRLTQLETQIDLLEKSQNTASTQVDVLMARRSTSIYNLLDAIDKKHWDDVAVLQKEHLLAQNKLQITTGEIDNFNPLIEQLKQEQDTLRSQLSGLDTIPAPAVGYFVSAENTQMLHTPPAEILEMSPAELEKALHSGTLEQGMEGLLGKIVTGYTWQFTGVCSLKDSERFNGIKKVQVSFPGKMETPLEARVVKVEPDAEKGIAKFTLQCDYVNADVLKLGQETIRIDFATYKGLRVNADAIRYVLETPEPDENGNIPEDAGENYIPGVYVKYGNLARFRRIEEIYRDETGSYILVPQDPGKDSVSEVRLYDEVIVQGQNLYDGKLL